MNPHCLIARKNRWDHIFLRKCRTIEKLFAFHKQTIKGNIVLVKERTIEARLGDTRNWEIENSFGKWKWIEWTSSLNKDWFMTVIISYRSVWGLKWRFTKLFDLIWFTLEINVSYEINSFCCCCCWRWSFFFPCYYLI